MKLTTIRGISIPDSQLARTVTEVLGDTESPSLLHHCSRVYYFSALAGKHRRLKFESALLTVGGEGISRSDATLLRWTNYRQSIRTLRLVEVINGTSAYKVLRQCTETNSQKHAKYP